MVWRKLQIRYQPAPKPLTALHLIDAGNAYDLIISDQGLEGPLTGLELWEALHEQESNIPYVLLSGLRQDKLLRELEIFNSESIPRFIHKQTSLIEFANQLSQVLDLPTLKPTIDIRKYAWFLFAGIFMFSFPVSLEKNRPATIRKFSLITWLQSCNRWHTTESF